MWRDDHVAALFIEDRVTRRATLHLLKALVSQLEHAIGPDVLTRARADGAFLRPVKHGEHRSTVRGVDVVKNEETGVIQRILPRHFDARQVLVLHNVVDRCSKNCAALNFLKAQNFAVVTSYGPLHDMWNSIKSAAKATASGRWWSAILKFVGVCNLNHGPFRSGAWGKAKQEALRDFTSTHTACDAAFRQAALKQQRLNGVDENSSDASFDEFWRFLCCLPSCVSAGPVCKFSRWMSIEQCWNFYRGEWHLLRVILEHLTPEAANASFEAAGRAILAVKDPNEKTGNKGKLLQRCPGYITEEVADIMDAFLHLHKRFEGRI